MAKLKRWIDEFGRVYGVKNQCYGKLSDILKEKDPERVDAMLVDVIANAKNYEKNLIKQGELKAKKEAYKEKLEIAQSLLDVLDIETIAEKFRLTEKETKIIQNR